MIFNPSENTIQWIYISIQVIQMMSKLLSQHKIIKLFISVQINSPLFGTFNQSIMSAIIKHPYISPIPNISLSKMPLKLSYTIIRDSPNGFIRCLYLLIHCYPSLTISLNSFIWITKNHKNIHFAVEC